MASNWPRGSLRGNIIGKLFEHDRVMRLAVLLQFIGSRESGRSAANDRDGRRTRLAAKSSGGPEGNRTRLEIHDVPLRIKSMLN